MPISTHGSATPLAPSAAPAAITSGKHQRQQPHRAAAELRRPQADRHHRQHVIEAGERMRQARRQAHPRMAAGCASAAELKPANASAASGSDVEQSGA